MSKVRCNKKWQRYNTLSNFARRTATNDARRLATDPPIYPFERKGGTVTNDYIDAVVYGQRVYVELKAPFSDKPSRARCEQVSVWLDGECIIRSTGKTGVFAEVISRIAHPMSRKTLVSLQQGYTPMDEAHAAN